MSGIMSLERLHTLKQRIVRADNTNVGKYVKAQAKRELMAWRDDLALFAGLNGDTPVAAICYQEVARLETFLADPKG